MERMKAQVDLSLKTSLSLSYKVSSSSVKKEEKTFCFLSYNSETSKMGWDKFMDMENTEG